MAQAVGFEPTELFRVQLISSQSRYDRFDTPAYIFWHRLAQRLEKCEISMQDNDEMLGTRHPIKPAVMGFPADKMTCRMQTFECSLLRPLEYICIFDFVARNFPQGAISSQSRYDRFDTSAYWALLRGRGRPTNTVCLSIPNLS